MIYYKTNEVYDQNLFKHVLHRDTLKIFKYIHSPISHKFLHISISLKLSIAHLH